MISHLSGDRPGRDDIGIEESHASVRVCPICDHLWGEHPANYWEGCRSLVTEHGGQWSADTPFNSGGSGTETWATSEPSIKRH